MHLNQRLWKSMKSLNGGLFFNSQTALMVHIPLHRWFSFSSPKFNSKFIRTLHMYSLQIHLQVSRLCLRCQLITFLLARQSGLRWSVKRKAMTIDTNNLNQLFVSRRTLKGTMGQLGPGVDCGYLELTQGRKCRKGLLARIKYTLMKVCGWAADGDLTFIPDACSNR